MRDFAAIPRFTALLGLLLCATGARAQAGAPAPLSTFSYDRLAPLDLRDAGKRVSEGVEVHTVSFASPRGGRATGLLFVPAGRGPFAGIVLQHGLPGSAASIAGYGVYLARHGAVVVALDAPFVRRGGPEVRLTSADSAEQVQLIVDQQRAVDLLLARRDVDPRRLAYVGRSYGAAMGALLAGVERRLRTYVLAVGDMGLVAHFAGPVPDPDFGRPGARWIAAMRPIEPGLFVGRAPPASIFFQSARRDEFIPVANARQLQEAARQPKTVRWYDSGHALNPQAALDMLAWLHDTVGTTPPGPADRAGPAKQP